MEQLTKEQFEFAILSIKCRLETVDNWLAECINDDDTNISLVKLENDLIDVMEFLGIDHEELT